MNFVLPFNTDLSKNRAKMPIRRGKHMFMALTPVHRALLKEHTAWLTKEVNNHKFTAKKKLYVSIKVFKPTHRMDAINFIDALCDIIKKAVGIDDRYFSVMCDWEIDKERPRIEVKIDENRFPTF